MHGILEILQVDKEAEPSFEVWLRRTTFVPDPASGPDAVVIKHLRDQLAGAGAVPPPAHWPIPTDSQSNLAQALPWYLEQYVQQPTTEMGARRAQNVLRALDDWGKDVFSNLFTTDQVRRAYEALADSSLLQQNRIEIHSADPRVLAWPWEALVDHHDCPVGRMMPVERRYIGAFSGPDISLTHDPPNGLNVLLVTARQGPKDDVDYRFVGRSIASLMIPLRLTMLRPPTLDSLRHTIQARDQHWDVLHFDCHGWWGSLDGCAPQGHLVLEDDYGQPRLASAGQLLEAVGDCCPQHIVLNACRSAMPDGQTDSPFASITTTLLNAPNVHDVTAMAYNLHVDGAEPFLMEFYRSLNSCENVCTAAAKGRLEMIRKPNRTCVGGSVKLRDWFVPVVYRRAGGAPLADLNHAKAYYVGFDRSNQINSNEHFLGRSAEMFLLDHCAEKNFSLLLIHGLAGQGKTTLLREFLWWRARTGDSRGSIWVDFENMSSAHDVLWHMAQALPNPPNRGIDIDRLESCLAQALAANPSWIVWDHVDAARQQGAGGSLNHFIAEDRSHLAAWLGQLAGSRSAVLAASRGPEPWLLAEPGCFPLHLGGLKDLERWTLVNRLLGNSAEKSGVDAPSSADDALEQLVFYVAGHPLMTIDAIARIRFGRSAQDIHGALRTDLSQLLPWQLQEKDARRLEQSLSCLDDASMRPVLSLLSLYEELVDEPMFRRAMRQVYGDEADKMVDFAFSRLGAAGLLDNRMALHPAVGGALRGKAALAPSDDVRRTFVETIADLFARPAGETNITIGTLHNAMVMAAGQERWNLGIAIGRHIPQVLIDRGYFERAITVHHELVAMSENDPDNETALSVLIAAVQTARLARNIDLSKCWLTQAERRADLAQNELSHEVKAYLQYQRGKLAELCGDIDIYREAILRARQHAYQSNDEQLAALIANELSHLSLRAGDPAAAAENAAGIPHDLVPLHVQAGVNRAQAEAQLAQNNYDEARVYLQRAIALDDRAGHTIGKAMNISLLGEVEGRANNFEAAITAFQDAVAMFEAAGDRRSAAITYHQWAKTLYLAGLKGEAGEYFIQSACIFKEVGDEATLVEVTHHFEYYLGKLEADAAMHMAARWISAGPPSSPIIFNHFTPLLMTAQVNNLESEGTDK